jgi:hypothetical protein
MRPEVVMDVPDSAITRVWSEVTPNLDAFIVGQWLRLVCTPNLVQMKCDFSSSPGPGVCRAPAAKSAGVERSKLPWGRKLL